MKSPLAVVFCLKLEQIYMTSEKKLFTKQQWGEKLCENKNKNKVRNNLK